MSDIPAGRDPDATRTSLERHSLLTTGTLIAGRYRVLALVGVGAMGMVYRVHDERLHVDVALKVLRPERAPDARTLERFEQELILARQVSHRNVVRIHDIGQDGDLHFLTMDLVDGRSLRQILQERGRLDVAEVVAIARDLAAALAAAHAQAIVHRDLKPANVLVDSDGRVFVTDFGVARSMHGSALTQAGTVVGTLDYLSPEQARGGEVDGRTDIYALGLMMFEMLAGERPFRGESFEEIVAARTAGRPRQLAEFGVVVPPWLARMIARCLASDPADRYQGARDMESDFAAGRLSRRWLPRHVRRPALAGVAGLLILAAGVWWYAERGTAGAGAATSIVAVLPLVDRTQTAGLDWLPTGVAEILAQSLAESPDLQVVDSLRVFRTLENLHLDPQRLGARELQRIGELLDVERLVTGSVREAGGSIRVELRLIDTRLPELPARTLHAEVAASADLFSLADRLGGELRAALTAKPAAPTSTPLSADHDAMAAYTQALERLLQGDMVAALPLLERAVAADPAFASAWVRLASAYDQLGHDDQASEAARKAVAGLGDRSGRISYEARALEAALGGRFEQAQQILTALIARYPHDVEARTSLAEAFGEHGQLNRARQELTAIVAASPNHPRAWYLLGKYSILAGDHRAAADDYLVRALVIQNRLGNLKGRADVENALGIAHYELGDLDEARQRYQNAIGLRRQIGDDRGVAAATANVARIELRRGQYESARLGLQQALEIVERIGDRQTVANLHNEIGALEERQGHFRQALERYRQSLALLRDLGNLRALAESYNNVGFTYYLLGDFDNAGVYARQAMQLYEETGNREGMMFAGQTIGLLALARGEWAAAEKRLLEVLGLSREFGDALAEAVALGQLGRVARFQGRYGAALQSFRDGSAALESSGDPRGRAELGLFQAELELELGMIDAARQGLNEVERLLPASGSLEQRAEWLRLRAQTALRAGDPTGARAGFEEAQRQASGTGSAMTRIAVGLGAAEYTLAYGDPGVAVAALDDLHRDAVALGHLVLTLESASLLARAQERSGRPDAAADVLRASLRLSDNHRPCAARYRLHAQLAGVLRRLGRESEASEQFRAAVEEVERVRLGLDASQQASFEGLDEVKQIGGPNAIDAAA